ncbi:MAG: 7,8-didemethyl-8-hydroxy-5-deazariboflavin synthase, partial [Rhodospirillaceae bacterium]|nr:7,8-didemethyl-8-hydroxy-5-deazariboflavin synthase [Rhodospirillaceae bacterium]
LALNPVIPNIQTSWVKLGAAGAEECLKAGVNDLGGTLMNESISRAAGAAHGQELSPADIRDLVDGLGRKACQRSTLYGEVSAERQVAAEAAKPLSEPVQTPAAKFAHGVAAE